MNLSVFRRGRTENSLKLIKIFSVVYLWQGKPMHVPKAERVVQQVQGNASTNMEAGPIIFFEIVHYFGLWHPISLTPEI